MRTRWLVRSTEYTTNKQGLVGPYNEHGLMSEPAIIRCATLSNPAANQDGFRRVGCWSRRDLNAASHDGSCRPGN